MPTTESDSADADREFVEVGNYKSRDAVYHTRDCQRKGDDTTEWLRSVAEDHGLRECKLCSGENRQPRSGNTDYYRAAKNWTPDAE